MPFLKQQFHLQVGEIFGDVFKGTQVLTVGVVGEVWGLVGATLLWSFGS